MALDLRLQHKMTQQLVMTPQLQQAIKLLQLNHLEMAEVLREEIEQNPLLEDRSEGGDDAGDGPNTEVAGLGEGNEPSAIGNETFESGPGDSEVATDLGSLAEPPGGTAEPTSSEVERDIDWEAYLDNYSYSLPASAGPASSGDELPTFEASLTKPTSLHDHLRWQLQMLELSEEESVVAGMLIEEITDDGYLPVSGIETVADDLELEVGEVEVVVRILQGLEPLGVAARDLRECLLMQCRQLDQPNDLLEALIEHQLVNVERRNYSAIAKALGITVEEVGVLLKQLATLDPRPGRMFNERDAQYISPDIYVRKVSGEWVITLNDDGLPKLRISNYYRNALGSSVGNTKSYIQERLRSAAWLIRSIHMRQRTIYKVTESILKFQGDFFDRGPSHLKPLILRDVADDVGMHESTISRVTTNKYVHTPQGIYELKYFFNSSITRTGGGENIASESVREHIKRLIDEEKPKKPLSDQAIVAALMNEGIDIARRTVAKYREMMKIPSSSRRKKVF